MQDPKFRSLFQTYSITGDNYIKEILEKYVQLASTMLEDMEIPPFDIPDNPILSEGMYNIGYLGSGLPFTASPELINRHILITGSSGSGKSNLNLVLLNTILSRM